MARSCFRLALALLLLVRGAPALAQDIQQAPVALSASSTDCSTASSCVELASSANAVTVALSPVSGTFQAEFEMTGNGGRLWSSTTLFATNSTTGVTNGTAAGTWRGPLGGRFRVRLSSCSSCAVLVTLTALTTSPASGGGGSGSNAAAGTTGAAVPSSAGYTGVNIGGNLVGVTGIATGATVKAATVAIVDSSGNQISTFGGAGGTSVNEDVASADAQPGTPAFSVRNDTVTGATSTDGDYQPLKSDAAGRLYTTGTGGTFPVSGTAATDAPVSGNPVFTAGRASAAAPTDMSADGDTVPFWLLRSGATVTQASFAGTLASTGTGASGGGTQRVVTATDSTIGTVTTLSTLTGGGVAHDGAASAVNPHLIGAYASAAAPTDVSADTDAVRLWALRSGALVTQPSFGGVLASTGAGNTGTGVLRVIEATDSQLSAGVGATGDAAATAGSTGSVNAKLRLMTSAFGVTPADNFSNPTGATVTYALMGCWDSAGGNWDRCIAASDPCQTGTKTVIPINISTATTTELTPSLAGGSNFYYVCSINIGPVGGAQNIAIVDDDTDNCPSVTAGMAGGTTAGSGWNIAANGGLVLGNGSSTVMKTNGTNRVVCAVTSAAVQTSGVITVVAAP